jgi:hypothetical protein
MRAQILALAVIVTVTSGVTACSIDVRERDENRQTALGMVVYPRAYRVANSRTDPVNVSFTGSFAEARVVPERFVTDDEPGRVLGFYRAAARRAHVDVIECRGSINIRRTQGAEKPVCIEDPSSEVVRLAAGTRPYYRMVAVKPRGTATEFTLVAVYAR